MVTGIMNFLKKLIDYPDLCIEISNALTNYWKRHLYKIYESNRHVKYNMNLEKCY